VFGKKCWKFFWDQVDFEIVYIAREDKLSKWGYRSSHGVPEIEGDVWELCAIKHYPEYHQYMPFLYCLNLDIKAIPHSVENCTKEHGLDFNVLKECFRSDEGKSLLQKSADLSIKYRVKDSPTVVMDGRLYNPRSDRVPVAYLSALCYVFDNPLRSFPWWVFGFMGGVVMALLVVVFIVKQTQAIALLEFLRNLFFHSSNDEAELSAYLTGGIPNTNALVINGDEPQGGQLEEEELLDRELPPIE